MKSYGAVRSKSGLFLGVRKGFLQDMTFDLAPEIWVDIIMEK